MRGLVLGRWLRKQRSRVCGVMDNGSLCRIYVGRMRGDPDGLPDWRVPASSIVRTDVLAHSCQ